MAEASEWQSSSPRQQGTVKAAKNIVNNGGDQVEQHEFFDQRDRASVTRNVLLWHAVFNLRDECSGGKFNAEFEYGAVLIGYFPRCDTPSTQPQRHFLALKGISKKCAVARNLAGMGRQANR